MPSTVSFTTVGYRKWRLEPLPPPIYFRKKVDTLFYASKIRTMKSATQKFIYQSVATSWGDTRSHGIVNPEGSLAN